MKNKTSFLSGIIVGLSIISFIFYTNSLKATNLIKDLTQIVSDNDEISLEYFKKLNGEKKNGGFCKYSNDGKLVCIDFKK